MLSNQYELSQEAHNRMKRRMKYDWKLTDLIFNLFHPLSSFLCWCSNSKRNPLNLKKRHGLFEKGETKFVKEFDAVYYARWMRNLNTLVTSMMDDSERFMIAYQKSNAISLLSDTTSSHSDDNYDDVPKLFASKTKKKKHVRIFNRYSP